MNQDNYDDYYAVSHGWKKLATYLVQAGRHELVPEEGTFVAPSIERGSTVIYPSIEAMRKCGDKNRYAHKTIYGAMGSPNQHELEKIVAQIEGGLHSQIVSSGLTACTIPLLAYLRAGDHCLLSDNVYGPVRYFCKTVLSRFGIEISFYPPYASSNEIEQLVQKNTRMIFTESPGSHSFEVQDIPTLARIAHSYQAKLVMDNTWGIAVFQPFEHGVDVSIQALTKYANGHSDLVLGAITVNNEEDWRVLRDTAIALGEVAGAEECWLTLRGLRTMSVRLERQSISALTIAKWLTKQPEISHVLHPALINCPGHQFWRRDFSGANSLFGMVFKPAISTEDVVIFLENLQIFNLGASWGGYESLALLTDGGIERSFPSKALSGSACRFQIGLEDTEDLIKDIDRAFYILRKHKS